MTTAEHLRPPLYTFRPQDSSLPGIEVQKLDAAHALRQLGPHRYRYMVLIYFRQGGGSHRIGLHQWQVEMGDIAIIAPGEVYDGSELGQVEGWVVNFTLEAIAPSYLTANISLSIINHPLLRPFAHPLGSFRSRIHLEVEQQPLWQEWIEELEAELHRKDLAFREAAQARLMLILIETARSLAASELNVLPHEQAMLTKVFEVINQVYAQPVSAREIADLVGLSSAYLTTRLRRLTGRTTGDWLTERRMIEACRLLLETDQSVALIAETVGYQDVAYFIRQFRRICGVTPIQWRTASR